MNLKLTPAEIEALKASGAIKTPRAVPSKPAAATLTPEELEEAKAEARALAEAQKLTATESRQERENLERNKTIEMAQRMVMLSFRLCPRCWCQAHKEGRIYIRCRVCGYQEKL